MTIPLVISGACGRMGIATARAAYSDPGVRIAGALEHPRHPRISDPLADIVGLPLPEIQIEDNPRSLLQRLPRRSVWIEFSSPGATVEHLKFISSPGHPMVIGTTGLRPPDLTAIRRLSRKTAVLIAPNMSYGVNVLYHLLKEAVRLLGPEYHVEILEAHHSQKKDAPSGTALRLAEVVSGARKKKPQNLLVYDRTRKSGVRTQSEIGVSSLRFGDAVGEHTVFLGTKGERIELTHRASSRDALAQGAVRAAKWIFRKKSGIYGFSNVLGIS